MKSKQAASWGKRWRSVHCAVILERRRNIFADLYCTIPTRRYFSGYISGENLFGRLFEHILRQCIEKGLVDGKIILTDSTHIKSSASSKANVKVLVERETDGYMERLN